MNDYQEYRRRRQEADEKLQKIIEKYQAKHSIKSRILFFLELIYHKLAREPAGY
ncbi:hypothetical protein [Spartinivicinus ruber]|uniref:hypothetical protein n=1 Tax=Spartinivicinus ruber TaxID=2683272 RepID=UPI0013D7F900|nr:hypothetical protein [Spartinivicinus ruber]